MNGDTKVANTNLKLLQVNPQAGDKIHQSIVYYLLIIKQQERIKVER